MEYMTQYDRPDVESPVFLFAFAGWADAAEAATHSLHHLVDRLAAKKFGEIDPEEFYDFTQMRPRMTFDADQNRVITWPANELFFWKSENHLNDLVILVGVEPNLKWKTFSRLVISLAQDVGAVRVLQIGAVLDAVPHTRKAPVTGSANTPELEALLKGVEARRPHYTGPTGISGILMQMFQRTQIPSVGLWAHAPHYLQMAPNPQVSLSLLEAMQTVLGVGIDVEQVRSQGSNFQERVQQALADEPEVNAYVHRLEDHWDKRGSDLTPEEIDQDSTLGEMPEPDEAVRDLEEFLRLARNDSTGDAEG